jgi:hypothetical protein
MEALRSVMHRALDSQTPAEAKKFAGGESRVVPSGAPNWVCRVPETQ